VCERIRINSKPISEELFTKYFFDVWNRLADGAQKRGADPRVKPTYPKFITLMSFHVFCEENVDVAVYEVGLGGEFDSTNVISQPIAAGITSLGIDHVQVLGNTIEEIAWHKAGIMKAGSPAYTVWQPEGAMKVLEKRANEKRIPLHEVAIGKCLDDVAIQPNEDFQKRNASMAVVLATQALARLDTSVMNAKDLPRALLNGNSQDMSAILDQPLPELFKAGLTNLVWRGRGEIVEKAYGKWHLDGAHTKESLEIVGDWFGRTVKEARSQGQDPLCILVFNQQSSARNAAELIGTLQQRLWERWGVRPDEAVFCTNNTYRNQKSKLGTCEAWVVHVILCSEAYQIHF
jgi:folylpolyglutamate synthase